MGLFAKKIEKQLASYQQELIETHYREVEDVYKRQIPYCPTNGVQFIGDASLFLIP